MPLNPQRSPRPVRPVAVVSAMAQELAALLAQAPVDHCLKLAGREFHCTQLFGQPVVLVLSGIGKVAAATTVALLVERFDVCSLVFTGVAGGLAQGVQVGDVVLATELLQHDMDARPLFPQYEVPLSGRSRFAADAQLTKALGHSAATVLGHALPFGEAGRALGIEASRLHHGLVLSGDRFVASATAAQALRQALPDALAVEMEGAAVAQVCHDFGLPFAVLRTVSDRADDAATVDFLRFIEAVAAQASAAIVGHWLRGKHAA